VSYGVRVRLRTDMASTMPQMLQLLPPGWKTTSSEKAHRAYSLIAKGVQRTARKTRRQTLLYGDGELIARSSNLETVLDRFEADLQLFVAESARHRVFVHSGVVGWRGKAVLIPGRSFSGKTTLVAELVRAGAVFYSDEYAVMDQQGRVHPYAKPLAMRQDGAIDQTKISVESLGGVTGKRALPVGLIVVSLYKAGARWRPRLLSSGKSVLELLANAVPARRRPAAALEVFQKVVMSAPALKGIRGSAAETARLVLQALDESL